MAFSGGGLVERQHVTHGLGQVAAGRERVATVGVLQHDGQLGRLERVQRETVTEERQVVGQLVAALLHAHEEVADDLSHGGRSVLTLSLLSSAASAQVSRGRTGNDRGFADGYVPREESRVSDR